MWNFGVEVWCNVEGQFVTIVADFTEKSGESYELSICSLGIMGAEYVRVTPAPTAIDVV